MKFWQPLLQDNFSLRLNGTMGSPLLSVFLRTFIPRMPDPKSDQKSHPQTDKPQPEQHIYPLDFSPATNSPQSPCFANASTMLPSKPKPAHKMLACTHLQTPISSGLILSRTPEMTAQPARKPMMLCVSACTSSGSGVSKPSNGL